MFSFQFNSSEKDSLQYFRGLHFEYDRPMNPLKILAKEERLYDKLPRYDQQKKAIANKLTTDYNSDKISSHFLKGVEEKAKHDR